MQVQARKNPVELQTLLLLITIWMIIFEDSRLPNSPLPQASSLPNSPPPPTPYWPMPYLWPFIFLDGNKNYCSITAMPGSLLLPNWLIILYVCLSSLPPPPPFVEKKNKSRTNRRRLTRETFSGYCSISRLSIWWTQESSPHGSKRPSSNDVLKQDTVHRNLPLIYLCIQWLHLNCLLLVRTKYWKLTLYTLYTFRFKTKKSDKKKREIRRKKIDWGDNLSCR